MQLDKKAYDWYIGVFTSDGEYIHGYYFSKSNNMGSDSIFYGEMNTLCYYNMISDTVCVINEKTNSFSETYSVSNKNMERIGVYGHTQKGIYVHKNAPCKISYLSASCLKVSNKKGEIFTICDFSEEYNARANKRRKEGIVKTIIMFGIAALLGVILSIDSSEKSERMREAVYGSTLKDIAKRRAKIYKDR